MALNKERHNIVHIRCLLGEVAVQMDTIYQVLCFVVAVQAVNGFIDLYETEHAQQQLAEEISDMEGITKAKEQIDKMKAGIGGTTIAIHIPSARQFIHRNRWIMTCNGKISPQNGHCNGNALESVTAFKPESTSDFCYIKTYHSINETLCLSPQAVNIFVENNTVICEGTSKFFPVLAISIENYMKTCKAISTGVIYIYFSNQNDPNHVEIPNENTHVKCDNEHATKHYPLWSRKLVRKALKEPGVCIFTEEDSLTLNLLQYLKL